MHGTHQTNSYGFCLEVSITTEPRRSPPNTTMLVAGTLNEFSIFGSPHLSEKFLSVPWAGEILNPWGLYPWVQEP